MHTCLSLGTEQFKVACKERADRDLGAALQDLEEGVQEPGQRIAAAPAAVSMEQLDKACDRLLLREATLDAVHVLMQPSRQRLQGWPLPILSQNHPSWFIWT